MEEKFQVVAIINGDRGKQGEINKLKKLLAKLEKPRGLYMFAHAGKYFLALSPYKSYFSSSQIQKP